MVTNLILLSQLHAKLLVTPSAGTRVPANLPVTRAVMGRSVSHGWAALVLLDTPIVSLETVLPLVAAVM